MSTLTTDTIPFLENKALSLRIDSIRSTTTSKSGHPTSCLSAADVVAALFFHVMHYDPQNPQHPDNDRFILSKGHAIPIVYAAWKHVGVISDEELMQLRKFNSPLEGHPTLRFSYNEAATGSLGQGICIASGMALAAQKTNRSYFTYVMLGDGECAEGSVWEAAEFASHYNLKNLVGIVDNNRLAQSDESIDNHNTNVMQKKWSAFGWNTIVIDGHNMNDILKAFEQSHETDKPFMIIAKTYKGYGLENVQDKNGFHGKPFKKDSEQRIQELKKRFISASEYKISKNYTQMNIQSHYKQNKIKTVLVDKNIILNLEQDPNVSLFKKGEKLATRKAYGYGLAALGRINKNVYVLDCDVKNSTFTQLFEDEFPERFTQCFIAEQNMIGTCVGMHLQGLVPFAATFAAFLTRAFDQIRMAAVGSSAIRLCGSHAGVSIGEDGPSQMGLEDIAMMRLIPNSIVLYPSDAVSAYKLIVAMANYHNGISYMRTTRSDTPILYDKNETFSVGKCKVLKQSKNDKASVVAAGITLHEALKAYDELQKENVSISIIDAYSIKPLDTQTILSIAQQSNNIIITVEDHYMQGGLGEAITNSFINNSIHIETLAVQNISRSGTSEELLSYAKIDAKNIVAKVKKMLLTK